MRTFIALIIVLLVTLVPVMAQTAEDEAAIRKANEERLAAWHAKDVKAWLSFFDQDCTANWDGGPCGAAVRESGEFPEAWKNAQIKVIGKGEVAFITPGVAVYRYTREGSGFADEDGNPQPPSKSHNVEVHVKKGGKWLVAVFGVRRPAEE